MVYGEITKLIPPLSRPKLGKKAKDKDDEIKKELYEDHRHWNDCRFQSHCNKLE